MELAILIGGAVIGLIGFFGGRYFTNARTSESLARKNALMDLIGKMRAQGVSAEQLRKIEEDFERHEEIRAAEDRLTAESYDFGTAAVEEAICQQDMNAAQGRRLTMLDNKLKAVLAEITLYLEDDEKAKLKASQKAWEKFRDQEAHWEARSWQGGSMQPLIFFGAASQLTVERLASLEAELRDERTAFEQSS